MFPDIVAFVELIFLILIWKDGREILKVERHTNAMYKSWMDQVIADRQARRASAAKARESKAKKAEAQSGSTNKEVHESGS